MPAIDRTTYLPPADPILKLSFPINSGPRFHRRRPSSLSTNPSMSATRVLLIFLFSLASITQGLSISGPTGSVALHILVSTQWRAFPGDPLSLIMALLCAGEDTVGACRTRKPDQYDWAGLIPHWVFRIVAVTEYASVVLLSGEWFAGLPITYSINNLTTLLATSASFEVIGSANSTSTAPQVNSLAPSQTTSESVTPTSDSTSMVP
ncbi:hypothetical protein FB451DRAFT_68175 [Mycena latifolia]|nr:hypothetical protein FB451DRAFT_68175 [Mycena latifolia]